MLVWVSWQFYAEHGELNCPVMQKKRKKVQTVRQVNANEVGDSQMMAISDEGVGVGVIQKLTIADRGGKRGL